MSTCTYLYPLPEPIEEDNLTFCVKKIVRVLDCTLNVYWSPLLTQTCKLGEEK